MDSYYYITKYVYSYISDDNSIEYCHMKTIVFSRVMNTTEG